MATVTVEPVLLSEKEQHQKRIISSFNASWKKLERKCFPAPSLRNHLANIQAVAALQPEIAAQLREMEQRAEQKIAEREAEDAVTEAYIESCKPSVSTTVEPAAVRTTEDVEPISLGDRIKQAANDVRNLVKGGKAK